MNINELPEDLLDLIDVSLVPSDTQKELKGIQDKYGISDDDMDNILFLHHLILNVTADLPKFTEKTLPLSEATLYKPYKIVRVDADSVVKTHILSLGFVVDETVVVTFRTNNSIIVRVKDSSIALDKEIVERIFVRVV